MSFSRNIYPFVFFGRNMKTCSLFSYFDPKDRKRGTSFGKLEFVMGREMVRNPPIKENAYFTSLLNTGSNQNHTPYSYFSTY